ncbi:MAG: ABC transporter permease, partial [Acidobacteria bacterium]|nr:ABC transporter permease [Acidobacteriota bacterium]
MLPPDPLDDELAHHREQLKHERLAQGDSPADAEAYARRRLGNTLCIQEEVRAVHPLATLETLLRHVRFASRSFLRHGGSYLLATALLALGIGLSVAMFSLVEAVVFAPLPYPQQQNIHLVWKYDTQTAAHVVGELAYPELADLRANANEIAKVALIPAALYGNGRVIQTGTQDPVQIEACPTTADLFQVLGIAPALGRDFVPSDEAAGAAPVVILSHAVWREHFNANPQVIGQAIRLNGVGHTVIGVMPPTVDFPRGTGLWLPLRADARRGTTWLLAVVRTPPGVSRQALHAAAERTFQLQVADHLKEYSRSQHAVVTPLAEYLTGSSRPQLLLALIASVLLLLSACVSASNLFLSRSFVRRREVATRTALGASTLQILAQFTVEGLLAATLATA